MPVDYHHLTQYERCQIHALLHRGLSQRAIARQLGQSPGTLSREMCRNRGQRGYWYEQAQGKAVRRRRAACGVPRKVLGYRTPAKVFREARVPP